MLGLLPRAGYRRSTPVLGGIRGLLNQQGFGQDDHPGSDSARRPVGSAGRCGLDGVGGHGDGVASVVGVGVAVGVEDFDGAV